MIRRSIVSKSRVATLAAAVLTVAGMACSDFTGIPASLSTFADSGTVWALNGAPTGAPSALHAYSGTLLPADANFVFDVAFDLDPSGGIRILPQRAVASGLATTHTVSLATVPESFEAVTSVPRNLAFRADTALVVQRDQVVIAQVTDMAACGYSMSGSTLFAKFVIRSVDRDARTMRVAYVVDPNCGFRSFLPGVPKD